MTSHDRKEVKKLKDKAASKTLFGSNQDIVVIAAEDMLKKCNEKHYADVYSLDISNTGITRIANLEKFIKLRVLDLSCNKIEWIDGLQHNQELRELKLYSNKISELNGLEKLKGLTNLILQFNNITEIGNGLKSLRALKLLRIDNNKINKVEKNTLTCCPNLSSLDMSNNCIHDLTNICCLKALTELRLANNQIEHLPDSLACKSLSELDLSGNSLTDVGSLNGLHVLNNLNISRNKIQTLESLGKMGRLQELRAADNLISSISRINVQFPALEILDIQRNQISFIEDMESLKLISTATEYLLIGNPVESTPEYKGFLAKIWELVLNLESLNKKQKRSKNNPKRPGSATIIMRKMSGFESKEVEEIIKFSTRQLHTFETSVQERFNSIRKSIDELLPVQAMSKRSISPSKSAMDERPYSAGQRPSSRSGRLSRLQEAMAFATENFTEEPEQTS
ncbi:Protein phosphatase 1 regulatory subunit 7 [Trichoplax sp. H2]|nr:Protein phosphatase 1 regulatory subunit 7 [Trichoplax sp. H2]|eukprot:RDD39852.1 Protein phosphatase 1 regulatory subunit 7 [Trichoplax sp. H2]